MRFYKNKKLDNFYLDLQKNYKLLYLKSKNEKGIIKTNLKINGNFFMKKNFLYFNIHKDSRNLFAQVKISINSIISGYWDELKLIGLGFIIYKVGNSLVFDLGYSHYIRYKIPVDIIVNIFNNNLILFSSSLNSLKTYISIIKSFCIINFYTGTGILNAKQQIKLKEGKLR